MQNETCTAGIFHADFQTAKPQNVIPGADILSDAKITAGNVSSDAIRRGNAFADEIRDRFVADFEKDGDRMAHVSTFAVIDGVIYISYYANAQTPDEDPNFQTARLAFAPVENPENKTFLDIQSVGDECGGKRINMVYDTIFARVDENTLYILWTAKAGETYYRLYRPFDLRTKTLGAVGVNRFQVGNIINDFSSTGIVSALTENGVGYKRMYSDIGIMQKFTVRTENGETYYYTGAYSGDFNCVIRSHDFITWEYVTQPDFPNQSKWENAVYVWKDRLYYFVRQQDSVPYGFLSVYDLNAHIWSQPVQVADSQSRSDFILYDGSLYLFHAPVDREHIGILRIDTEDISRSQVVLWAKMHSSCFYPFVQYFDGELAMSYTVARRHIRLAKFDLKKYLE